MKIFTVLFTTKNGGSTEFAIDVTTETKEEAKKYVMRSYKSQKPKVTRVVYTGNVE